MRSALFFLAALVAGCATNHSNVKHQDARRDIESYAIASCFCNQSQTFLKDQGDAWASAIIQRTSVNIELLTIVSAEIKAEIAKGEMAVIRNENGTDKDKPVPLLYCYEIIDKPAVRLAIQKAMSTE